MRVERGGACARGARGEVAPLRVESACVKLRCCMNRIHEIKPLRCAVVLLAALLAFCLAVVGMLAGSPKIAAGGGAF